MKIIQSKLLNQFVGITHGFTSKRNGNLAFHVGDDVQNVHNNHLLLAKEMQYEKESLLHMKQIHSNSVKIVNANSNFDTPLTCDALITDLKKRPLMVMVADCSPILFYDKVKKVIAVAHAGRAGAFHNIVGNVVASFVDNYDSNPSDIIVSVGASIGVCCYEVGEEIYTEAKELNLEYAVEKREKSYFLNIAKILKTQLLNANIEEKNIEFSEECSCCSSKKYFSYRAESQTGRFAGLIYLN
jgi:hypothetical protein